MGRLLASGLLYLIVIAIVLSIKPTLMFTEDGTWKEFGIGRSQATHTWMPFWLFAILSALISYIIVSIIFNVYGYDSIQDTQKPVMGNKNARTANTTFMDVDVDEEGVYEIDTRSSSSRRRKGVPASLPEGYYVLNREATEASGGVPKYVYIGKGL